MTGIVLADDHTIFTESLALVLVNAGFSVLAVTESLTSTIDALRNHQPQVCLLDRLFADGDGLASIGEIIAVCPDIRILLLTADEDTDAMLHAVRAGAAGYLHKTWGLGTLLDAVGRITEGEIIINGPRETRRRSDRSGARQLAAHLTTRERECLALLIEGLDTHAMTRRLGVSPTTVRSHVQALMTKLGVHSRLEAASFAVRHGLIEHHLPSPAPLAQGHGKAG